jgi:hypothetical protein
MVAEGKGGVGASLEVGVGEVVFVVVVLGVASHAVCESQLERRWESGLEGMRGTLSMLSRYDARSTEVVMFDTRSAVPREPDGLAGLRKPQLELLGAALMVVAAESMTDLRSCRSWTAAGTAVGTRRMPVKIIVGVRNCKGRENIVCL